MTPRRLRAKVWILWLWVAAVAVGAGGWRLYSLSRRYQERAERHEQEVRTWSSSLAVDEETLEMTRTFLDRLKQTGNSTVDGRRKTVRLIESEEASMSAVEENAELTRARIEYHDEMALKYRRAAERPWRPVAPDPPEPPLARQAARPSHAEPASPWIARGAERGADAS